MNAFLRRAGAVCMRLQLLPTQLPRCFHSVAVRALSVSSGTEFDSNLRTLFRDKDNMSDSSLEILVNETLSSGLQPTISNLTFLLVNSKNESTVRHLMALMKETHGEPDYLACHFYLMKISELCTDESSIISEVTSLATSMYLTLKTFNMLLLTLSRRRMVRALDSVFSVMISAEESPDQETVVHVLHGHLGDTEKIFSLLDLFIDKYNLPLTDYILSFVITLLTPKTMEKGMKCMQHAFDHSLPLTDQHFSTFLIRLGRIRNNPSFVTDCFRRCLQMMEKSGIRFNSDLYLAALNISANTFNFSMTNHYWLKMQAEGILPSEYHYSAFIRSCAFVGRFNEMMTILNEYQAEGFLLNLYQVHSLMHCCARARRFKECLLIYDAMKDSGLSPTVRTYTKILYSSFRAHSPDTLSIARSLLQEGAWDELLVRGLALVFAELCQDQAALYTVQEAARRGVRVSSMVFLPMFYCAVRESHQALCLQYIVALKELNVPPSQLLVKSVVQSMSQKGWHRLVPSVYRRLLSIGGLDSREAQRYSDESARAVGGDSGGVRWESLSVPQIRRDDVLATLGGAGASTEDSAKSAVENIAQRLLSKSPPPAPPHSPARPPPAPSIVR